MQDGGEVNTIAGSYGKRKHMTRPESATYGQTATLKPFLKKKNDCKGRMSAAT